MFIFVLLSILIRPVTRHGGQDGGEIKSKTKNKQCLSYIYLHCFVKGKMNHLHIFIDHLIDSSVLSNNKFLII